MVANGEKNGDGLLALRLTPAFLTCRKFLAGNQISKKILLK